MLENARIEAKLSREAAAAELHICNRSLYDIEKKDATDPAMVLQMAKVYGQPDLPVRYCSCLCPIGQIHAHPVEQDHMAVMVMGLLKEINDIKPLINRIVAIAADGELTEEEKPEFENIMRELVQVEKQIGELKQFAVRRGIGVKEIMPRKEKAPVSKPALKINFG